jgi:hypothetical protein
LLISRPLQGRAFFEGGRDHFHHRLIDSMGMRLSAATYIFVVATSSIAATLSPKFSLVVLCGLCAFYFTFARLSEGEIAEQEMTEGDELLRNSLNIVPMNNNNRREQGQSWATDRQ